MSERWVKATDTEGDPVWINMVNITEFYVMTLDTAGKRTVTRLHDVAGFGNDYIEPPEHFLPPAAIEIERLRAFVRQTAGLKGDAQDERFRPDADGIVREARKVLKEIEGLTAKAWAERYS